MSNDLWIDDINRLRELATGDLADVESDLDESLSIIKSLQAESSAFGGLDQSTEPADCYEDIRAFMENNTSSTILCVQDMASNLNRIADLYDDVENANDLMR